MASKVVCQGLEVLRISLYIRGYHAYMQVWTPVQGEMLILKREPMNVTDRNAVAVFKEEQVVGHVPFNLAPSISQFLRREINKAFAEVIGGKVNRGAGYGLEIPCIYHLYGPKAYIDKFKELVDSLKASGLL